jgi:hypothetical protein
MQYITVRGEVHICRQYELLERTKAIEAICEMDTRIVEIQYQNGATERYVKNGTIKNPPNRWGPFALMKLRALMPNFSDQTPCWIRQDYKLSPADEELVKKANNIDTMNTVEKLITLRQCYAIKAVISQDEFISRINYITTGMVV